MLPRDVRVLSTVVSKTALPPKDTGTVLGVVDRDPVTTYRRVHHGFDKCWGSTRAGGCRLENARHTDSMLGVVERQPITTYRHAGSQFLLSVAGLCCSGCILCR